MAHNSYTALHPPSPVARLARFGRVCRDDDHVDVYGTRRGRCKKSTRPHSLARDLVHTRPIQLFPLPIPPKLVARELGPCLLSGSDVVVESVQLV